MKNNALQTNPTTPATIDERITKLLQTPADKTEYRQNGNTTKVQKVVGNSILNIEIREYPNGEKVSASQFSTSGKKADFEETIKKLASEGMRNKDIAELLDIDPSYVSKLKNK